MVKSNKQLYKFRGSIITINKLIEIFKEKFVTNYQKESIYNGPLMDVTNTKLTIGNQYSIPNDTYYINRFITHKIAPLFIIQRKKRKLSNWKYAKNIIDYNLLDYYIEKVNDNWDNLGFDLEVEVTEFTETSKEIDERTNSLMLLVYNQNHIILSKREYQKFI